LSAFRKRSHRLPVGSNVLDNFKKKKKKKKKKQKKKKKKKKKKKWLSVAALSNPAFEFNFP